MHWCYQEQEALMVLLSAIPLIGIFFKQLHVKWHAKWKTLCQVSHHCESAECKDHNLSRDKQDAE